MYLLTYLYFFSVWDLLIVACVFWATSCDNQNVSASLLLVAKSFMYNPIHLNKIILKLQ